MKLHHSGVLIAAVVAAGCEGVISTPASPTDPAPPPYEDDSPDVGACREPSLDVYERLRGSCAGCHRAGTSFPGFRDLEAFENLIAYNPRFVAPGDPEHSSLVAMLEGRGTGSQPQMPLGEESFADLEARGATAIGLDEIRAWIVNLEPCELPSTPPVLASRLTARQVRGALYAQLGLSDEDFFGSGGGRVEDFPLRAAHEIPEASGGAGNWRNLGGANYLRGARGNTEVTPLFGQTLVPLSQAWCRKAIAKPSNPLFFRYGSADASSDEASDAIRRNIEHLYLHMLGVQATPEDVDAMFEEVFLPYEARETPRTAWIAVCATFIRDPLWISH
ncbi:MAG: hypothetical protein AAGE52_33910 [Myxococcota bacterium]